MQHDLEVANVPYKTDEGQADFHALRHTYLSRLGRSGASPKAMQRLARHTTVELTLGKYTHVNLYDLKSAVEGLPPLPTAHRTMRRPMCCRRREPTQPTYRQLMSYRLAYRNQAQNSAFRCISTQSKQYRKVSTKQPAKLVRRPQNPEKNRALRP